MIFHIPKQRIKGGPMIYPEYRLHSIVFALRSVVCYYFTYYSLPKIYNIVVCFVTMILADIFTEMYPSGTTTMRQMPFESGVDVSKRKYIIMMQSFHQIGATLYMVGNEDSCFSPMFAIQLAALLMTLVRKSIITTNTWHIIYNISLGINIFVFCSLSIQYIALYIVLIHLFFYWRLRIPRKMLEKTVSQENSVDLLLTDSSLDKLTVVSIFKKYITGNKYLGWKIVFSIYLWVFQNENTFTFDQNSPAFLILRWTLIIGYGINHIYGTILPFC